MRSLRILKSRWMNPEQYILNIRKAISLFKLNNHEHALSICNELIKKVPDRKGAYLLAAQIQLALNQLDDAEAFLRKGIENCHDELILSNLGIVLEMKGEYQLAIEALDKVKDENAKSAKHFYHKGRTNTALGKVEVAIQDFSKCIFIQPSHYSAHSHLANLYTQLEKLKRALYHGGKAIEYAPDDALVHNNLGSIYEKLGDRKAAEEAFRKSIRLDPGLSVAYFNLSLLIGADYQQIPEALEIISKGLEQGDDPYQNGLRFYQIIYRQQILDWDYYDKDLIELNKLIEQNLMASTPLFHINPYLLSNLPLKPELYKRVAEKFATRIKSEVALVQSTHYDHTLSKGKIKVGYYSPNFRLHPGGILVRSLFSYHDESKFEIHAFSLISSDDFISEDIKESVDYFHDVSELSSKEIADFINRVEVDILVALAGYNAQMKFDVLALRPAPIQMILRGSHETTGADFVDYAFSDEYLNDGSFRKYFTESLITLPCSLMLNSEIPKGEEIVTTRSDHDLPSDQFIFASFNHPRGIDPETFDAWMQILNQTEKTILWIYDGGIREIQQTIIRNAEKSRVNSNRIVFAPKVEIHKHWERLKHADLMLDCFCNNAPITVIEALRMNLPIITKKGPRQNSTLSASILHYSGLSKLITFTKNDYIQTSIELVSDAKRLFEIRENLKNGSNKLLFDTQLQMKYVEKAYELALVRFKKDQSVQDFKVGKTLNFRSLM